jgi:hypothetical protein
MDSMLQHLTQSNKYSNRTAGNIIYPVQWKNVGIYFMPFLLYHFCSQSMSADFLGKVYAIHGIIIVVDPLQKKNDALCYLSYSGNSEPLVFKYFGILL